MKKYLLIAITSIGLLTLTFAVVTNAQSTANGQALEIAPPVINLKADPGQTIKTTIKLRNISLGDLIVTGHINDFVAGGEDGTPKILLEDDEESPYSIKGWINPLDVLNIKSKQLMDLPVTINVPADAAPGGYFGVVRFSATAPELDGTGVSLSASLGSLILLRVSGDVQESLSIEEFSVNKNGGTGTIFEAAPLQFVERFKNTGSVHEQPSGKITLTDMFNNKIAVLNVNLPPTNILPGSIRKYTQTLDSSVIGNRILFGQYKADLRITYGSDNTVITKSISFWVIPYTLIGLSIIGLIGLFIGLRFAVKRYNSYIRSTVLKSTQKRR